MSYAFTVPLRGLGAGASFTATAKGTASATNSAGVTLPDCKTFFSGAAARECCESVKKTSGGADKKLSAIKDCASKEAEGALKDAIDCKKARVTKVGWVDDVIEDCCDEVKRGTGNLGERTKGVARCIERGLMSAGGTVAGTTVGAVACAATGIGATVSYACGLVGGVIGGFVGGFVYDRVSGYDSAQITAGVTAGVICAAVSGGAAGPICGMVAAELIGWLSDSVGPVIEGIFDPGAAKQRELAARTAYHAAIEANQNSCEKADEYYRLAWGLGVHSLKELYKKAFPTATQQAAAKKLLGFDAAYDGIARAMRLAGARATEVESTTTYCWKGVTSDGWAKKDVAKYQAMDCSGCAVNDYVRTGRLDTIVSTVAAANPWHGVTSAWTTEGPPPWSKICPFSICKLYYAERERKLGKSPSRDAVTAWEVQFAPTIEAIAQQIYPAMVSAIAHVATQITVAGVALKQQELRAAADSATLSQFAVKAAIAASRAEAAADAARHGDSKVTAAAVAKAANCYDIAKSAYAALVAALPGSNTAKALACTRDASCVKAKHAVDRALAAKNLAIANAATTATVRTVIGAGLVAGIAGGAYLLLRK